jgi:hypothetical protein
MQSSPASCHLIPLRPKYSPQHPILKHPQPMILPRRQRCNEFLLVHQLNFVNSWVTQYGSYVIRMGVKDIKVRFSSEVRFLHLHSVHTGWGSTQLPSCGNRQLFPRRNVDRT